VACAAFGDPEEVGLTERLTGHWLKPKTVRIEGEDLVWSMTPELAIKDVASAPGGDGSSILEIARETLSAPYESERISPKPGLLEKFLNSRTPLLKQFLPSLNDGASCSYAVTGGRQRTLRTSLYRRRMRTSVEPLAA
jgi:hypothetical protein